MNYYNEIDPFAAAWLRELIRENLIAPGEVDERSIVDVEPADLAGFTQCHFFSGIGGWSLALRIAGWPDDMPVWTGSCPCQPFSVAGKGQGAKDARHLWPEFFRLIQKCRPATILGEQVASKDGRDWLAGVRADLEVAGYAVGAADLCAAGVSAPHIRQRLWWVAEGRLAEDADSIGRGRRSYGDSARDNGEIQIAGLGAHGRLAESASPGPPRQTKPRQRVDSQFQTAERGCDVCGVADAERQQKHQEQQRPAKTEGRRCTDGSCGCGTHSRLGIANSTGPQPGSESAEAARYGHPVESTGFWSDSIWHPCRDGKARRIASEPIFQFTFDGISNKMGHYWSIIANQIERWVMGYAEETKNSPREILRTVWSEVASQTIQRSLGRYDAIHEPEILLVALCKLARSSQQKLVISTQDIAEIHEGSLRALWRGEDPSCPSQEQGLDGPSTRELGDALCCLSPRGNTQQKGQEVLLLRGEVAEAWHVSKTLSALEKVWRSVLNESEETGNSKRIRADTNIIIAAGGFPLAHGLSNRVGILRGAGNAIVPQVAAQFIGAFMDIQGQWKTS